METTIARELILNGYTRDRFLTQLPNLIADAFIYSDFDTRSNFYTNLMNTARYFDLEDCVVEYAEEKALEWNEPELWENIKEFEDISKPAKFPDNALPAVLQEYVNAAADFIQVKPEMCILPMLSTLSLCVQGKARVKHHRNSHTEPLSIYTLTVAPPGERKTAVTNAFMSPVYDYQAELNRHYPDKKTLLTVTDITPEALALALSQQGEKLAVIDDEGSIFDVLGGIYSNGQSNLNIFVKSYDNSPCEILRRTRDDIVLQHPSLAIGLMTQPQKFKTAMANQQFIGSGFIQRFLFAFPGSMVGYINDNSPDIPHDIAKLYTQTVKRLLQMKPTAKPISWSKQAISAMSEYHEYLQQRMRENGALSEMKEWASKHFGRTLRIAGILHLCEYAPEKQISKTTAEYAVRIAQWAENQAMYAFGETGENKTIEDARYILNRLKKNEQDLMTKYELLRLCSKLSAKEMREPLEILADMNCIRVQSSESGKRGKPKELIKVNPALWCKNTKQFKSDSDSEPKWNHKS